MSDDQLVPDVETVTKDWTGLREILDDIYPSDVFTGLSGDPGPTIVVLSRRLAAVEALCEHWKQLAAQDQADPRRAELAVHFARRLDAALRGTS